MTQINKFLTISKFKQSLRAALGNNFQCNDYTALLHHAVDTNTEELMADVLGVEVFRSAVADQSLVGTYSLFTNAGLLFEQFF